MPLREVARLEAAPEPPGGLVPYRLGSRLAYADTSGRVHIPPFGRWPGIQGTFLFQESFVVIHPLLRLVAPLPGGGARSREPVRLVILNARGEVLLVRRSEAARRLADGSLYCVPYWQAYGSPVVEAVPAEANNQPHFTSWQLVTARPALDRAPALATGLPLPDTLSWDEQVASVEWLSRGRIAQPEPATAGLDRHEEGLRHALGNWQGRRLTSFDYSEIGRFHEGVAVATIPQHRFRPGEADPATIRKRKYSPRFVYLDTTGRQLTAANLEFASAFRYGRAVVQVGGRMGIIDRRGRYVLPPGKWLLSGPDQEGYIMNAPDDERLSVPPVRILAPAGKRPLTQVFSHARDFRQGRAEVSDGVRAGLLDTTGRWLTTLPYDVLKTPNELRSQPDDDDYYQAAGWSAAASSRPAVRSFSQPDSTLLVGRRQGKIGLVARTTGQELVAARYDAVVLNPCHGMACLQRDGVNYLVSSFNGGELAATYQGYDFLTPQGRRLVVVRPKPLSWALADTLATLRTPWLPGIGYPTPQGNLVSVAGQAATLYSAEGKPLLSAGLLYQPQQGAIWSAVEDYYWYRTALVGEPSNVHYQLVLDTPYPLARGVYFAQDEAASVLRAYDAGLRMLGAVPYPPRSSQQQLVQLYCGWSTVAPLVSPAAGRAAPPLRWFTDAAEPLPLPPAGTAWAFSLAGDYPRLWYQHGLLPTSAGYVTRGRRLLWQN